MQRNSFWLYRKSIDFSQRYKKFFILDFEATCDKQGQLSPQEIIEFPCFAVDSTNYALHSKFHKYVKPVIHPELTPFCTHLTGISQSMVESSEEFPPVLEKFNAWLKEHFIAEESIFVTCGNWDLRAMLPNQCNLSKVQIPPETEKWINLKTAFFQATNYYPRSLHDMSVNLKIPLEGRLHSGIDDCRNIQKIMEKLTAKKFVFEETDSR